MAPHQQAQTQQTSNVGSNTRQIRLPDGTTFTVTNNLQPEAVSQSSCLHKKTDRNQLPKDKLSEFFTTAVKKTHPRYKLITPNLKGDDSLQESHELAQLIRATKDHHTRYDMGDVFTIVFPVNLQAGPDLLPRTVNLYSDHMLVTPEEVSLSNAWYQRYINHATMPWIRQNLQLTSEFGKNECDLSLHNKVMESYDVIVSGSPSSGGGPLHFKLMMDLLVSHTESIAESLVDNIKSYDIKDLKGEDVGTAVTLMRNATKRLYDIRRLPTRIEEIFLDVYQTTTVEEFNFTFRVMSHDIKRKLLGPSAPHTNRFSSHMVNTSDEFQRDLKEKSEAIHLIAQNLYTDLVYKKAWHGANSPGDDKVTLPARSTPSKTVCWNCGEAGHRLDECPKPKNNEKIEKARKAFLENKKSTGGADRKVTGKFAPPKSEEKNRRTIDGKPMFFNRRTKRWVDDRDAVATTATSAPKEPASDSTNNNNASQKKAKPQLDPEIAAGITEMVGNLMLKLSSTGTDAADRY